MITLVNDHVRQGKRTAYFFASYDPTSSRDQRLTIGEWVSGELPVLAVLQVRALHEAIALAWQKRDEWRDQFGPEYTS